jgi:hypothetical protein
MAEDDGRFRLVARRIGRIAADQLLEERGD